MEYEYLTQEEQDDYVAEAMRGREWEHFQRAVNIANYEKMLETLEPGERRVLIVKLLGEEQEYTKHEEHIYTALSVQLPHGPRREAAKIRVAAKIKAGKPV
jgi:hypothetical protein